MSSSKLSQEFREDMLRGWSQNNITSADAFSHYYAHFTRDQDHFESNLHKLTTPITVMWGEKDFYIKKEMGVEFAKKAKWNSLFFPVWGTIRISKAHNEQSTKFVRHLIHDELQEPAR